MNEKEFTVLVFACHYLPGYRGGGPIRTVKNLFDEVGDNISFKLVTSDRDLGDSEQYSDVLCGAWNEVDNAHVFYSQRGLARLRQIVKIMFEKQYDIVYLNSFFSIYFSFVPVLIAKMLRKKIILGPRGEFSEGALGLKSQKKSLFIAFYKLFGLHHNTVFQASSNYEAEDIRRVLGPKIDIFVAEDIGAQKFASLVISQNSSILRIVFVSRISPKKNLIEALRILSRVKTAVEYDIYGPIEDHNYWVECLAIIEGLPPQIKVSYQGELHPDEVVKTISGYDLFFMPTKGENYGHVIAEALCAGLPILVSDATPWRNLQDKGIGWDLPLSAPHKFGQVIEQLAVMSADEYQLMRENVLTWSKTKFSQRDTVNANIAMLRYVYETAKD